MKPILLASVAALALGACTTMSDTTATADNDAPAAAAAVATVPDNVLLADWAGPYDGVPPFDRVRPDLFPEAFQANPVLVFKPKS